MCTGFDVANLVMKAAMVGSSVYLASKSSKVSQPSVSVASLAPAPLPAENDTSLIDQEIIDEETRLAQQRADEEVEAKESQIKADTLARKKSYFLSPTIKTASYGLTGTAPTEKKKLKSLLGE